MNPVDHADLVVGPVDSSVGPGDNSTSKLDHIKTPVGQEEFNPATRSLETAEDLVNHESSTLMSEHSPLKSPNPPESSPGPTKGTPSPPEGTPSPLNGTPSPLKVTPPTKPDADRWLAKDATDPRFLGEFFQNSRLHHISTMGANAKARIFVL